MPPAVKTPPKTQTEPEVLQDPPDQDPPDDDAENQRINAIVTSRVKREMKPLLTALQEMRQMLQTRETPPEPKDDPAPNGAPAAPQADPVMAKQMLRIQKELEDERKARVAAEAARAEEAKASKRNEMRSQVQSLLAEAGITDRNLQRSALNILEEDGLILRDDNDRVRFKGTDKYGIETLYDPKVGLKSWLGTEGKSFLPPVDAGGSGTGGARTPGAKPNTRGMSKEQIARINFERAFTGEPPIEAE